MNINEIFDEIFGVDFVSDFQKNWEEFEKRANDLKLKVEDDGEKHSYCHEVEDEYENGEHTYHREKEVKDGKVVKDESFANSLPDKESEPKAIEADKEEDPYDTIDYLRDKIAEKKSEIDALRKRCKEVEGELKEKDDRIEYLEMKLDKFKESINNLLK